MARILITLIVLQMLMTINAGWAASPSTKRIMQIENDRVSVWKTVVYPTKGKKLKMHRHEHDRVLVALTGGELKIVNDRGESHVLNLAKGKSYYLTKDVPNELHSDQNMSTKPIEVLVIEMKSNV